MLLLCFLVLNMSFASAQTANTGSFVYESHLSDFSREGYSNALNAMLPKWEKQSGKALVPGEKGKIALKVYSNSGAGIETPKNLVRALISYLRDHGWKNEQIIIIDADAASLREAGYLPPISLRRNDFDGVSVVYLSNDQINKDWFFENALPPWESDIPQKKTVNTENDDEGRKSYLPYVLVNGVDFWINLPVVTDHPSIGINGALANSSLWAVTNRERFWRNPVNAAVAIAEINAIPEFHKSFAMNILSTELYQYIGGPVFNSRYTKSEPVLYLSSDPIALDMLMFQKINKDRLAEGFKAMELPIIFRYAASLNLGTDDSSKVTFITVDQRQENGQK